MIVNFNPNITSSKKTAFKAHKGSGNFGIHSRYNSTTLWQDIHPHSDYSIETRRYFVLKNRHTIPIGDHNWMYKIANAAITAMTTANKSNNGNADAELLSSSLSEFFSTERPIEKWVSSMDEAPSPTEVIARTLLEQSKEKSQLFQNFAQKTIKKGIERNPDDTGENKNIVSSIVQEQLDRPEHPIRKMIVDIKYMLNKL